MKFASTVVLVLLACTSSTSGQSMLEGKETLRGLSGVYVSARPMSSRMRPDREMASSIESAVKAALRSRGIRILTPAEYAEDARAPCYCIEYVYYSDEEGFSAFHMNFLLQQKVDIPNVKGSAFATTWDTNAFAAGPAATLPSLVETAKIHAAAFSEAFREVN